jgi:hypothetical protein
MLGQVSQKNTNTLIILQSDLQTVKTLVSETHEVQSALKGFDGEFALTEITQFHAPTEPKPLAYRSTRELIRTFEVLQDKLQQNQPDEALRFISELRKLTVQHANPMLSAIFLQTLNKAFTENFDKRVLSGLVSLAQQYMPASDYERILRPLLLKIERHGDERTRANSILTRAHYESDIELSIKELRENSNRLLADGLYVLGKKSVDSKLMKQITWMVKHQEKKYKASALYLCSALLRYHKEKDIVYFKSNPYFNEIKEILKNSMSATDPVLRKHAIQYQELSGDKL